MTVARRAFGSRGYEATSLRTIATLAKVDPALLVHYFGTKDGLFLETLEDTVGPFELFSGLDALTIRAASREIVRRYLTMLEQEQARDVVMSLVRSAVSCDNAAKMLREFLTKKMLASLTTLIDKPDRQLRASLIVAQLVGVAMLRYVAKVGIVRSATNDELIALIAPVVERYLR